MKGNHGLGKFQGMFKKILIFGTPLSKENFIQKFSKVLVPVYRALNSISKFLRENETYLENQDMPKT